MAQNRTKVATLRDVARLAEVSDTSASFVLRGRADELGLSPALRKRVQDAASKLGYRPNRTAVSLRQERTRVIGFVAPNMMKQGEILRNYTLYPFIVGLSRRLVQDHYHIVYLEMNEFESSGRGEALEILRERFFDGLIVHHGFSPEARATLEEAGVPVLWWDANVFEPVNCLRRDEEATTRTLVRHLVAMGHRRIAAHVGGFSREESCHNDPMPHFSVAQRYESFCAEMALHGLTPMVVEGFEIETVAAQLREHDITAVLTQGGEAGLPLFLRAATQVGLRIPEDLSVASLDLETHVPQGPFPLAGMLYDRHGAGQQAAEMLLAILQSPLHRVPSVKFGSDFRDGDTVRPFDDATQKKRRRAACVNGAGSRKRTKRNRISTVPTG